MIRLNYLIKKNIFMKPEKEITKMIKNEVKPSKVFKPLNEQQLESVVGGPVASRGTVTNVQSGG
jgi:bacteriocin-like protein